MIPEETRMAGLTIGKVATAAGVGVETIRFYEKRGLIVQPVPTNGKYRHYPTAMVARIRFIKRAQTLGFTLAEIKELLLLSSSPNADRKAVKEFAQLKVKAIREKIFDLQQMERTLSQLVSDCSGRGSVQGCPIIEAISDQESPFL